MNVCLGLTYGGILDETFKNCIYHVSVYRIVHGIYFKMIKKCQISTYQTSFSLQQHVNCLKSTEFSSFSKI